MSRREEFQEKLSAIPGVRKAYYNPPTNIRMEYPCIRYSMANKKVKFACNGRFVIRDRYTLTLIDRNPESPIIRALEEIPYYSFDRMYSSDGLYHFVCTIYY